MLVQKSVEMNFDDQQCIYNAIQAGHPACDGHEKEKRPRRAEEGSVRRGGWPWASDWRTSASKRITEKMKRLADEEAARVEIEDLEALVKERNRQALIEGVDSLLLANTERHKALKAGLIRCDWLGALKEQEKWKEHLRDLNKQRDDHYRQMWGEDNAKALEQEEQEKHEQNKKVQELKESRLRHLEKSRAKQEGEKAALAEEARQLRERVEQENYKFAWAEQQKCARRRQTQLETAESLSKAANEKLEIIKKISSEEKAEAAFAIERAEKLRLLERHNNERRQRQVELCAVVPALRQFDITATQNAGGKENFFAIAVMETERNRELHRAIAGERLRQQQMKMQARADMDREDAVFTQRWMEENEKALLAEVKKSEERRQKCKEIAAIQEQQIADVKERKQKEREDDRNAWRATLSQSEKREETVRKLELRCIENALEVGTSSWPLLNMLNKHSASSVQAQLGSGKRKIFVNKDPNSEESGED